MSGWDGSGYRIEEVGEGYVLQFVYSTMCNIISSPCSLHRSLSFETGFWEEKKDVGAVLDATVLPRRWRGALWLAD